VFHQRLDVERTHLRGRRIDAIASKYGANLVRRRRHLIVGGLCGRVLSGNIELHLRDVRIGLDLAVSFHRDAAEDLSGSHSAFLCHTECGQNSNEQEASQVPQVSSWLSERCPHLAFSSPLREASLTTAEGVKKKSLGQSPTAAR